MEMRDRFSPVPPVVDHHAIAGLRDSASGGKTRRGEQQVSQQRGIFFRCFCKAPERLFGNDQKMCRRLRIDIRNGDASVILVQNFRWNFAGDDFFKKRHTITK